MFTKIIKLGGFLALAGGAFLRPGSGYALVLQFIIVAAAVVVLTQAASMHCYVWMAVFSAVALLLNPVYPMLAQSPNYFFVIASTLGVLAFLSSLGLSGPKPRLSVASITGSDQPMESL